MQPFLVETGARSDHLQEIKARRHKNPQYSTILSYRPFWIGAISTNPSSDHGLVLRAPIQMDWWSEHQSICSVYMIMKFMLNWIGARAPIRAPIQAPIRAPIRAPILYHQSKKRSVRNLLSFTNILSINE